MDKALRYLALAAKAGHLTVGAEDCAKSMKPGKGHLLLTAADAAPNTVRQMEELARSRKTALARTIYTKQDIAHAIGRYNPVAVAMICDKGLAEAFAKAAAGTQEQEE